jgi:prepilin-type processing-associated H-X9-DG protein
MMTQNESNGAHPFTNSLESTSFTWYGVNYIQDSSVKFPSGTISIIDSQIQDPTAYAVRSGDMGYFHNGAVSGHTNYPVFTMDEEYYSSFIRRHLGGLNGLFYDGHVENMAWEVLYANRNALFDRNEDGL